MSDAYIAQHGPRFEAAIARAVQTMINERPLDPVRRVGELLLGDAGAPAPEAEDLKARVKDLESRLSEKEAALQEALRRVSELTASNDKSLAEPTDQPKRNGLASLVERARQAQPSSTDRAAERQAKFAESTFTLAYTSLSTFFEGLEALVGMPSPNLRLAMRAEHCGAADSALEFTTNNYGVTTTSTIEWWAVVDPATGRKELKLEEYPSETFGIDEERKRGSTGLVPLKEFLPALEAKNAALRALKEPELLEEELLAGRLYTGPMVRRGSPPRPSCPLFAPCAPRPRASHNITRLASYAHSSKSTTWCAARRSTRRRSS